MADILGKIEQLVKSFLVVVGVIVAIAVFSFCSWVLVEQIFFKWPVLATDERFSLAAVIVLVFLYWIFGNSISDALNFFFLTFLAFVVGVVYASVQIISANANDVESIVLGISAFWYMIFTLMVKNSWDKKRAGILGKAFCLAQIFIIVFSLHFSLGYIHERISYEKKSISIEKNQKWEI